MSNLDEFVTKNGPALDCESAKASVIAAYKKKLPEALIEFWKESGFCGYAEGLVWIVDPTKYSDLLTDWDVPKGSIVFGRTAFADLMLWAEGQVQYLFVHHGRIAAITDDLELYINSSLTSDSYLDKALMGREFKKVVRRLGRPAADECYAFVPALALGGSGKIETIQKVKLREHLGILAELVGG